LLRGRGEEESLEQPQQADLPTRAVKAGRMGRGYLKMIGRITMWVSAALVVLALAAPLAFAASPSERECEAAGGTFTRSGGQVSCVIVEEGKPHPNDKFDSVETESSNGTLQNQPHHEEDQFCTDTGSGKCPPGQF
jgi:hypothetical protein